MHDAICLLHNALCIKHAPICQGSRSKWESHPKPCIKASPLYRGTGWNSRDSSGSKSTKVAPWRGIVTEPLLVLLLVVVTWKLLSLDKLPTSKDFPDQSRFLLKISLAWFLLLDPPKEINWAAPPLSELDLSPLINQICPGGGTYWSSSRSFSSACFNWCWVCLLSEYFDELGHFNWSISEINHNHYHFL